MRNYWIPAEDFWKFQYLWLQNVPNMSYMPRLMRIDIRRGCASDLMQRMLKHTILVSLYLSNKAEICDMFDTPLYVCYYTTHFSNNITHAVGEIEVMVH